MAFRYKPSKAAARQHVETMKEIEAFCREHGIQQSRNGGSYYFTVNGQQYRVSNHSVESSNSAAFDWLGNQTRDLYHADGRDHEVHYIHAGKARIIDIYNDLAAGIELDGRGNRK